MRLMPDDGQRYEIIDGDLIVNPSPSTTHQKVSKRLQFELMRQIEETGAGVVFDAPTDVIFSKTRTVVPDLLVVRASRSNIITERGIERAPDVVIEILSPSGAELDKIRKRKLYAEQGVPEYWIVDPATHAVEVLTLATGVGDYETWHLFGPGDRIASSVFEIDIDLDRVFRP